MCQHQALYHKENTGYVVKCPSCNKIQIGYGIVSITFDVTGFENFRYNIENTFCRRQPEMDRHVKSVVIPSPCEGINLLLSLEELETLHCILEEADNEMKALCLINEFQKTGRI
jgi:hypothetical protein